MIQLRVRKTIQTFHTTWRGVAKLDSYSRKTKKLIKTAEVQKVGMFPEISRTIGGFSNWSLAARTSHGQVENKLSSYRTKDNRASRKEGLESTSNLDVITVKKEITKQWCLHLTIVIHTKSESIEDAGILQRVLRQSQQKFKINKVDRQEKERGSTTNGIIVTKIVLNKIWTKC